jgi:hypothetical protein
VFRQLRVFAQKRQQMASVGQARILGPFHLYRG